MSADVLVLNFTTDPNVTGVTDVFRWIIEEAFISEGGGGGGAVDSVNGQTGVVVLDATDVGAVPSEVVDGAQTSTVTVDGTSVTLIQDSGASRSGFQMDAAQGQLYFSDASADPRALVQTDANGVRLKADDGVTNHALTVTPAGAFVDGDEIATAGDLTGLATTTALTAEATARSTGDSTNATAITAEATARAAAVTAEATARTTADGLLTPKARVLTAGTGLTGGGDLSADRSFAVAVGDHLSTQSGSLDPKLFEQTQAVAFRGLAALAAAAATSSVLVLGTGDSIVDQQGNTVPGTNGWVDRLNQQSTATITGKKSGKGWKPFADAPGVPYAPNSWANPGTITADTTAGLGGNGGKTTANGQTGGDTEIFDVMDFVYQSVPSGGATLLIKDEAGTTVATINTTDGALSRATLRVQRITMPTGLISHAWTVTQSGSGTAKFPAYIPHIGTATAGLLFLSMGRGGTDAAYWVTNVQSVTDLMAALVTAGSSIGAVLHGVGGNDAIENQASGTNTPAPATVRASIESYWTSIAAQSPKASRIQLGEYYVSKPSAGKTSVGYSTWVASWMPQFELAAYNSGAFYVDMNALIGDASEGSGTIGNGITFDNGLHLNDTGQLMFAGTVWNLLAPRQSLLTPPLLASGATAWTGDMDMGGNSLTDSSSSPFIRFKKFMRGLLPSGAVVLTDEANDGTANAPRLRGYKDATAESGNFPQWAFGSFFGKGLVGVGDSTIGPNGYLIAVSTGILKFLKPDLTTRADLQAKSLDLDADAATSTTVPRLGQVLTKALATAKGSLVGFSASGTPVELTVGADGRTLQADSSQSSGLGWVQPVNPVSFLGPTGCLAETVPGGRASIAPANLSILGTGTLKLFAVGLIKGQVITSISFVSRTTAGSGMTNQWFGLFSSARVCLKVTADDTSTAWSASAVKTLNLTSTYTVPSSGIYYIGVMVAGTVVPTLLGIALGSTTLTGQAPILGGDSSTGQTVPFTVGATATAITAGQNTAYAWVA